MVGVPVDIALRPAKDCTVSIDNRAPRTEAERETEVSEEEQRLANAHAKWFEEARLIDRGFAIDRDGERRQMRQRDLADVRVGRLIARRPRPYRPRRTTTTSPADRVGHEASEGEEGDGRADAGPEVATDGCDASASSSEAAHADAPSL